MSRRLPAIPTALVLAAAAVMVALGIWQLGRAQEKEALIAQSEAAIEMRSKVAWPTGEAAWEAHAYRWTEGVCEHVQGITSRAARNTLGQSGWGHFAQCLLANGNEGEIAIGWSRDPRSPSWEGGDVEGIIAPSGYLVSADAKAGLQPLAPPDPGDLPNNHLAYAGQWFFFAITALVIYWLALRRRWRDRPKG